MSGGPPGALFARIRTTCAEVAARARHVRIDADALCRLAARLEAEPREPGTDDPAHLRMAGDEATLAYVVTLDAINFGSGWFPLLRKRGALSGYFSVALALRDHFAAHGPWSARELTELSGAQVAQVLGQDASHAEVGELMERYATSLRDLGALLAADHAGSFGALVENAGGRAERLVGLLAAVPSFRDVSRYQELEVPFYKRAQITAADLARAFRGCGPGRFTDLDALTLFADNLVPHVLRVEGVLVYAPALLHRIEVQETIPAGSHEEVEIRAVALHAVERLVGEIRRAGGRTSAQELDQRLWTRGQRPEFKAHPRHRTRSWFY